MASKHLTTFFLFLSVFDLFSLSDASLTPISSAVEVLSDSGYFSMGLTLKLATNDLSLDEWQELTIFAPSDQAFTKFGQPSLLDIKYQLSPTRLPGESLRNLPSGAEIPTLRSNSYLSVTNSSRFGGKPSINNVVVQDSPVFDDGYVVIYGAEEFFKSPETSDDSILDPSAPDSTSFSGSFPIPSSANRIAPSPNVASDSSPKLRIRSKPVNCFNIFESASSFLISRGFMIMATFLALQLEEGSENDTRRVTVFAPIDEAIPNPMTNFSDYATIFKGHVINQFLCWTDLQKLALEGSILQTILKGYEIEVSCSGDNILLNGVPIIYPDLYVNEWIAIHGFNQMIKPEEEESSSVLNNGGEEEEEEDVLN